MDKENNRGLRLISEVSRSAKRKGVVGLLLHLAGENLISSGLALRYLPDYFVKSAGLIPLKISGCPYSCHYKRSHSSWMAQQTLRSDLASDVSGLATSTY